jgi:hypothetical protein
LAIAVDILEHLTKKDGYSFIQKAKGVTNNLLISTPYIHFEQEEMFHNKHEKHLSGWNFQDFKNLGCRYLWRVEVSMVGIFSDRELTLPLSNNIEDAEFDTVDLEKISRLLKMYFETSQNKECIKAGEFYLSIFGHNPLEIYLYLAVCHEKINDPEKAKKYAKMVLDIDSANTLAGEILKRLKV